MLERSATSIPAATGKISQYLDSGKCILYVITFIVVVVVTRGQCFIYNLATQENNDMVLLVQFGVVN